LERSIAYIAVAKYLYALQFENKMAVQFMRANFVAGGDDAVIVLRTGDLQKLLASLDCLVKAAVMSMPSVPACKGVSRSVHTLCRFTSLPSCIGRYIQERRWPNMMLGNITRSRDYRGLKICSSTEDVLIGS